MRDRIADSTSRVSQITMRSLIESFNQTLKSFWQKISKKIPAFISKIDFITVLELSIIALIGISYSYSLANFDPNQGLTSGEFQVHVGFMTLFAKWLGGQIPFPLWNPVMGYGRSLIADPFVFFFNPFISFPMILFGIVNGTKIAVVLNFIIAGVGMWYLARSLGMSRLTRLWCGLIYMMSGAIPSHLHVGQVQLSFSLAWLPWAVAGLILVIRRKSTWSIAMGSIAMALFFFSANLYHQVYALFCLLIISIIFAVDWNELQIKRETFKRIIFLGLFSIGLIAVQFVPMAASRASVQNIGGFPQQESDFEGSQLPEYAFLNYVIADPEFSRHPILDKLPFPQENYRFVGIVPVLLLLFLVPAFQHGNRKEIIAFGACFLFLLAWAALRYTFIKQLYAFFPILYQFRDPGRALSVGGLFLILLSGYGLDELLRILRFGKTDMTKEEPKKQSNSTRKIYRIALILLAAVLVFSARRVYGVNRELIYAEWIYQPEIEVAVEWLRTQDQNDISINATHTVADKLILDAYEFGFRSINFMDGWRPSGAPYNYGEIASLPLIPRYRIDWEYEEFSEPLYKRVFSIGELNIWESVQPYPYAFGISMDRLLTKEPVLPEDVVPAHNFSRASPNKIEVDITATEDSILVITESWFKDWKVRVDNVPAQLSSVSNFLAVPIKAGRHSVVFEYLPWSFVVGLIISGMTVLCLFVIIMIAIFKAALGRGNSP